jgi:hypothetical protein
MGAGMDVTIETPAVVPRRTPRRIGGKVKPSLRLCRTSFSAFPDTRDRRE